MTKNNVFPKPPVKPIRKTSTYQLTTIVFVSISSILAIIAIILALFNFNGASTLNSELDQTRQTYQQQISQIKQDQATFEYRYTDQINKNTANLEQLLKQTTNLSAEQAKGQANYLIYLAQLKLQFSSDTPAAIELLELAQHQIANFHTPDAEELKQRLKQDIQVLQKVPKINKPQLLATLDDIMIKIKKIPLIPDVLTKTSPRSQPTKQESVKHDWWQKTKDSLSKLKSFIIIRRIDNPSAIALSPDQKLLVKQSILLKLSQAEWALLNNQPDIYYRSLTAAKAMLSNINASGGVGTEISQQIKQLLSVSLTPKTHIRLISLPTETNTKMEKNK